MLTPRLADDPTTRREDLDCVVVRSLHGVDGVWSSLSSALCDAATTGFVIGARLFVKSLSLERLMDSGDPLLVMMVPLLFLVGFSVLGWCWTVRRESAFGVRDLIHHGEIVCDRRSGRAWLRRDSLGFHYAEAAAALGDLEAVVSNGRRVALAFRHQLIAIRTSNPAELAEQLKVPLQPHPLPRPNPLWRLLALFFLLAPVLAVLAKLAESQRLG